MPTVTIICSDPAHPVYACIYTWARRQTLANVTLVTHPDDATGGDFLFLVSCSTLVGAQVREKYRHTLVLHASDLPRGRGWSPHIWTIACGGQEICLSLLEADDKVDTGRIWLQKRVPLEGHELYDEINALLFDAEIDLIERAIIDEDNIVPCAQAQDGATYLRRRKPEDSRIDPTKSLAEQFDLLRVLDPQRFPGFFDMRGQRYRIVIEKILTKEEMA